MVSRPEAADHTRRARSVASRTTRTKHHRGSSHRGGSAYQPQNEFPFFAETGDVEIVISADGQEKRYLLHRLILAQCSGFFEAGTSAEWSHAATEVPLVAPKPQNALTKIGEEEEKDTASPAASTPRIDPQSIIAGNAGRKRWRYELDWDHVENDEEPMLVQKTPSTGMASGNDFQPVLPPPRSKPPTAHAGGFLRSMANLTFSGAQSTLNLPSTQQSQDVPPISPLLRDYDNLFRIFYNYSPSLNPTYLPSAYSESKALLTLADMYDALPVVGPRIDHHLLRFSSRLFKQIAKYPPSYLRLGYLARSRIIFTEAMIHVVGRWPLDQPHLRGDDIAYEVPEEVIELIEDKVDELEEMKARVEARLFRLTLTTSRGERVNPTNDYLGWLAMSLFRQWLAESTTPPVQGILRTPASATSTAPNHSSALPRPPHSHSHSRSHSHFLSRDTGAEPSSTSDAVGQTAATPHSAVARQAINMGRVYRTLGSTNPQCYLSHDELKQFLKLNPAASSSSSLPTSRRHVSSSVASGSGAGPLYTRDTLHRFERKMEEIKNLARNAVKPLTRNFLELDVKVGDGRGGGGGGGGGGRKTEGGSAESAGSSGEGWLVQYLTCTRIEEDEVPWDY